jgi:hypothetical protein
MVTVLKKILQTLRPGSASESEQAAIDDLIATFRTMTSLIHTINPTILAHNDDDASGKGSGIAGRSPDDV